MYANKSAFWFCFPHNTEMSSFETFSSLKLPGCPGAQYQCSISRKGLLNMQPEGLQRLQSSTLEGFGERIGLLTGF